MIARTGVDELDIDAHSVSATLDAAFGDIADIQLAPDCPYVRPLVLVRERGVARDHQGGAYPGEFGRKALSYPIDEMLLLLIASNIAEG
jgi:hypothetical protein